jgi:hypothetical protein
MECGCWLFCHSQLDGNPSSSTLHITTNMRHSRTAIFHVRMSRKQAERRSSPWPTRLYRFPLYPKQILLRALGKGSWPESNSNLSLQATRKYSLEHILESGFGQRHGATSNHQSTPSKHYHQQSLPNNFINLWRERRLCKITEKLGQKMEAEYIESSKRIVICTITTTSFAVPISSCHTEKTP